MLSVEEAFLALQMVDHRNVTIYTYNEELAVEMYGQLKSYLELLDRWLKGPNERAKI